MTVVEGSAWPADYEARKEGVDCSLCATIAGEAPPSWELVAVTGDTQVYVDHRAVEGYCVVVWARDHRVEPTQLDPEEAAVFWRDVLAVGRAVESVHRPVKVNYLILGNAVPHLHAQVLPRHASDPAPGQPLPFSEIFSGPAAEDDARTRRIEQLRDHLAG